MSKQIKEIENIVVGVDLTEESRSLVENAKWLARTWNAQLILVHVQSVAPYLELNLGMDTTMLRDLKRDVQEFYETREQADIRIEIRVGSPNHELEDVAAEYAHPMILVGHSSKGTLERFLLGSASRSLATSAHVPLMIC